VTARRRAFGRAGEDAAAAWYESRGFDVLARNWRVRSGELDLVVARPAEGLVVFCEVKARTGSRYGSGLDAVDRRKQQRLRSLALQWLASQDRRWAHLRFDVVDVDARGHLRVVEAAF
jgi:putative endonuclease